MIRVTYGLDDKGDYSYLKVTGHAEFADEGKDLICASVSSIFYGLMNALDEMEGDAKVHDNRDDIEIMVLRDNQTVQDYIRLVMYQLKTIEESYGRFIKIKERK